jgi:selenocysteine lyase/cysteine desulfurase
MLDRREFVAAAASLAARSVLKPSTAQASSPPATAGAEDDPLGVRPDFPLVAERTFLNGAYIMPCPRQVIAAGQAFAESKARPMTVGDLFAKTGEVRTQFARLINATPEETGFVYGTTEGENIVANNVPMAAGDNVVVDELLYDGAMVVYRELERRRGIELRIVKHRDGAVTPADIAAQVNDRTRLVSVAWVSHLNGFRHDLRAIADIAHAHGALVHTDAIQAVGMFPVDVRAADVDFLCCGTYKWLLSGFGAAPFYIRQSLLGRIPLDRFGSFQVDKHLPGDHFELKTSTARRYEYATIPFLEIHQLGAALAYLEKVGVGRIETHVVGLADQMHEGLQKQGFKLFTPAGNRSGVVSFYCTRPAAEIHAAFDAAKVDITVRDGYIRAATCLFNNAAEVDRLLAVTRNLV